MLRWPSIAAIASRDMPRLIAWVARVCRSWWGWMCGSPAAAPALLRIRVTVCRSRLGRSPGAAAADGPVGTWAAAVVVDQRRPAAGAVAGSGPRGACRPGRAARVAAPIWTTASAGRAVNSPTRSPVRSSTSTVTRTRSRLSLGRRGAAWRRRRRRAPWAAGGPGGAGRRGTSAPAVVPASQPHSSMRTKNIRSVPSRCARVAVVSRVLFCPGRFANQGL